MSASFIANGKHHQNAEVTSKGAPWRYVLMLLFLLQAGAAHALSTACTTLNATSGTSSATTRFYSTDFAAGESVVFSFDDDGQGIGGPTPSADQVNIRSRDLGTLYLDYRSNTGSQGPHSVTVSASQLAAGGLYIRLATGTYISPVTISCTAAVSTDASLAGLTLSAGTLAPAFTSAITGYAASVNNATASLSVRPTASASGATITVNGAAVASGTDSSPIGLNVGANGIDVVVTAADGLTSRSYAINVTRSESVPTVSDVTTSVPANSANNPIPLTITGNATAVAIASTAAHGTATVSATAISYTPAAGYSGTDSFTYTASNAAGTSAPATVTITVTHPTLAITPASGPLPDGQVGVIYSQALSSTGGTSPYLYSATALPPGLSLNTSTGALEGTPTTAGNYRPAIVVTDANGATGSVSYSLNIAATPPALPVAGAVSATVAPNSRDNAVTLDLSGGAANSVAIASSPAHGSATVAHLSITYTPAPGFAGTDSFTYTATNTAGTSSAATVTITVSAASLALSPAPGALPRATLGTAYSASIHASGGTAPYRYTAASLPDGLSLDAASGLISGTPMSAGAFSFSVTATDGVGIAGTATYSLEIGERAPVVAPVSATVAANTTRYAVPLVLSGGAASAVTVESPPTHGTATATGTSIHYSPDSGYSGSDSFTYSASNAAGTSATATVTLNVTPPSLVLSPATGELPVATVGTAYHQVFSATGGSAPYSYSATGLPAGLSLDAASGSLSGVPSNEGSTSFSLVATDAYGVRLSATYTLVTHGNAPRAVDTTLTVGAGQTVSLDLGAGASGGPFTSATLLDAPAQQMGSASLNRLQFSFTAAANASGTLTLRYTLSNAWGTSSPSTLTLQITGRPDPSQDQEVVGLLNAQTQSAAQFARAQISNFNDRLEQLHAPDGQRNAFNLRLGLAQAQAARQQPDDDLGIFRSLSALQQEANDPQPRQRATHDNESDQQPNADTSVWTGGYVDFGKTERSGAKVSNTMIGVSAGVDYRLSRSLTVGAGIGFGRDKSDIGSSGSTNRGDSYSAALYGSYHPGPVFLDALLGYSWLSFDSDRYVAETAGYASGQRKGDQLFGSLSSGYEARGRNWLVSPYARLDSSTTWLRSYSESDAGNYNLEYADQRLSLLSSVAGVRGQYGIPLGWSYLNLRSRLEYSHTFNADGTARLGYTDVGDSTYAIRTESFGQNTLSTALGVDFLWASGLTTGIGYQGTRALGEQSRSDALSLRMAYRF